MSRDFYLAHRFAFNSQNFWIYLTWLFEEIEQTVTDQNVLVERNWANFRNDYIGLTANCAEPFPELLRIRNGGAE